MTLNRKIKLTVAYDGTNYCGFQIQKRDRTIELELVNACKKLFNNEFILIGASRTDAGVHALCQVVSVETVTNLRIEVIPNALNSYLPEDISIQNAEEAALDFHPRYDAISKTYLYQVYNQQYPLPQLRNQAHFCNRPLNIEQMLVASQEFIGEHDFISFSSAGGNIKTSVRTIYSLEITQVDKMIVFKVHGNGFLYHMVRKIVGILLEVGVGKLNPEDISRIIEAKNRTLCKRMAPACGLTLAEIVYSLKDEDLD